jgi:hypothetical protein
MKTIHVILLAFAAGLAIAALATTSLLAPLAGMFTFAILISAAILGFAAYDYSRKVKVLATRHMPIRPLLPSRDEPRYRTERRRSSALVERAAA